MHAGDGSVQHGARLSAVAAAPWAAQRNCAAAGALRRVRLSAFWVAAAYTPAALAGEAAQHTPLAVSPISTSGLVQVTLGLAVVLALILLLAWLLRRFGPLHASSRGTVRLLGGVSLGQRERAMLVQVGDKQLLLGVAPGNVRTLHVFDAPVQPEAPTPGGESAKPARAISGGFAERLQAALSERIRR